MSEKQQPSSANEDVTEVVGWAELLETKPPGVHYEVVNLSEGWGDSGFKIKVPDLQLYCGAELCGGARFFESTTVGPVCRNWGHLNFFLDYRCRNCKKSPKIFAVRATVVEKRARAVKLGESPVFGPPTPSRVISLIGPDRDVFLKGRHAESQGLGIGAFAYYRRVVENQKGRIIGEIAKVAKRLGAKEDVLKQFETAIAEGQFKNAIERIKDSIPQSLLIDSHNPLTLLYSALSEGLHAQTDEACLEFASSIRIVMTELADRINTALKDEAELKHAINRLLNRP